MPREQFLARPKSRLEALPTELIQDIFLRCLEFNLPRASAYLAWALSNPTVYTWLVRLAFAKAEGKDESDLMRRFFPPHDVFGYIGDDEMRGLRTRILECRWCTLPLIRDCQIAFMDHVFRDKRPELEIVPDDQHLLDFKKWFENSNACDKGPTCLSSGEYLALRANRPGHIAEPGFIVDYSITVVVRYGIINVHPTSTKKLPTTCYQLPYCEGSYLPEKLLYPPWTEEKLNFLQLLSSRALLDKDTDFYRATRTLRNLIRERDFPTFARLLDIFVRVECYSYPIIWPCGDLVFRAALKHADANANADGECDPFVKLLVEKRWNDIEPEDIFLKEKLLRETQSLGGQRGSG